MEARRRKLAIWGRDNELLELNRGEQRKKRVSAREEEGRADGELGKRACTTWRRRWRPGDAARFSDGQRTGWRSFGRTPPPIPSSVEHRKERAGSDRWVPHVSFKFG